MTDYDVIIIGSGAGGGTLARALADSGKRVLILERGERTAREPQNWDAREVFGNGRYVSADSWLDRNGTAFQPQAHYTVGGATKFYGAALLRMREHDFTKVAHRGGISPAWPVTLADFAPYYEQTEQWYHVQELPHAPVISNIAEDMYWRGWTPEHAPSAVHFGSGAPCIRCDTCDGFPCQVAAKGDAETCGIEPALATGNVTLLTGTRVTEILCTLAGRACGVRTVLDGVHPRVYLAPVVVLAAGAVNSAALWLRSGIPDSSGQAGRNYMCHQSQAVLAVGKHRLPRDFHKTLAFFNYYERGPAGYPLGSVQMAGQPLPAMLRGESRLAQLVPGMALHEIAARSVVFWLISEDLPDRRNRVTVDANGRITLAYTPNNPAAAHGLYRALARELPHVGYPAHLPKTMPLSAVAHQCGTLRMAATPADGPVSPAGEAWSTPGLFVADASVFVSSGAVNPALTVMAHALRVARNI